MKRISSLILAASFMLLVSATYAAAHCEIPCGIYDDQMRVNMIEENIATMEKSMKQIIELQGQSPVNYNQLVRWIMNKDHHAEELQQTVTQYFMTQRIKPDTEKYNEKLTLLHKMLISAMLCKQTTDLAHINTLRSLLKEFSELYFAHSHK